MRVWKSSAILWLPMPMMIRWPFWIVRNHLGFLRLILNRYYFGWFWTCHSIRRLLALNASPKNANRSPRLLTETRWFEME